MASFFERNHGNSVLKQQQQTASLECYVCFLKAITSSCKSEYLSSKKSSGQTNKCFWYSFHFLGSSTNPPSFLILNPGTRSFSENAKGSQSPSTTSPLWASHHGKYERKAILTGNWKDPQRNTHYAETFSPPIKNRADRYTHKPMAPFTVGPLCPTVFKSKSLWLNEHIPGRTWDCSEGSQCCNILKTFR